MPTYPRTRPILASLPELRYGRPAAEAAEVYPFHLGDTWLRPPCGVEDLNGEEVEGLHRYAPVRGRPELLAAIAERVRRRTGVPTGRRNLVVTSGATAGLAAVAGAIVDPGDEVLLPAPYWPLYAGIVSSFGGRPIAVPFFGRVDSAAAAVAALEHRAGRRTVALYLNSPNNPTGEVLPPRWLAAIVDWARRRDLWLVADEVYEDLVFRGEHTPCRPLAPERTFSAHSFSKAFAFAGHRCGYVVGPTQVMGEVLKVSSYTAYSSPTVGQLLARRALTGAADRWLGLARESYRRAGSTAARILGVEPPAGGTFLFLDAGPRLGRRGLPRFLETCAEHGLRLSPGSRFGPYPSHFRMCFTAAPPEVVERGARILAGLLGASDGPAADG